MTLDTTLGGSSSDSYGTLIEADSYHLRMGNPGWAAASSGDREVALRRGVVWLDGTYRKDFPGQRLNGRQQALEWPRTGALDYWGGTIDQSSIPPEIINAQFEAALVELVNPGSLSPQASQSQVIKSEKVGPISTEYAVGEGGVDNLLIRLSSVDRILSGLLTSSSDGVGFMAIPNAPV